MRQNKAEPSVHDGPKLKQTIWVVVKTFPLPPVRVLAAPRITLGDIAWRAFGAPVSIVVRQQYLVYRKLTEDRH
jgi:hypothetical protein